MPLQAHGTSAEWSDRHLQTGRSLPPRSSRPPEDLRHAIDAVLREIPEVEQHRWVARAPEASARPWSALEIRLRRACDAQCAHEIERRLLSVPGVRGLGPHWPRPEPRDRTLILRLYSIAMR